MEQEQVLNKEKGCVFPETEYRCVHARCTERLVLHVPELELGALKGHRWEILVMGVSLGTGQLYVALTSMNYARRNLHSCHEKIIMLKLFLFENVRSRTMFCIDTK